MNQPEGTPQSPSPTPAQIAATISLLADDHSPVQVAARERLLRWGDLAIVPLQEGAEADSVRMRARCRAVLRTLEVRKCLRRFAQLRIGRGGRGSPQALVEGAALLSNMVRTFVPDAVEIGGRLRREATNLRRDFAGRSLPVCARRLAQRLHHELGLQGGDASALEPDHVLIDRVLERGTGVPVSLALLWILVARWAGLSASGVAMPDHFLVRLHGVRPVLIDPYHAGRAITKADCARHLRSTGHEQVNEYLRDLSDREVLIHYLRCLRNAAHHRGVPETQQTLGHALALLETS